MNIRVLNRVGINRIGSRVRSHKLTCVQQNAWPHVTEIVVAFLAQRAEPPLSGGWSNACGVQRVDKAKAWPN